MAESPILHLTAVVTREGDWYVARSHEVEATSQVEVESQEAAVTALAGIARRIGRMAEECTALLR